MLLPRKWAKSRYLNAFLTAGLMAVAPSVSVAGPFDFAQPEQAQTEERSNQQVAEAIAKALSKERLQHKNVQIEYKAGVATIGGEIQDQAQRAKVTAVVSQIPEVKRVQNDLRLINSTPSAFRNPFATADAEMPADQAQQPIQQAAAQGAPNRQVQQVSFDAPTARSNQAIAEDIAAGLAEAGLKGFDVEIRFKNGIASLIGSVENQEQAMRAHQATANVQGVRQVINKLSVKGGAPQIQQTAGMPPQGMPPQGYPQMPPQMAQGMPPQGMPPGAPPVGPHGPIQPTQGYSPQPMMGPQGGMPPRGHVQPAGHHVYNQPTVPQYAWPSYAQYDNYAAVSYPSQYDASAFPYIGPYYPYPQVPMGWRASTLEWDDGYWNLKFDSRTDKWWWFLNPKNWD